VEDDEADHMPHNHSMLRPRGPHNCQLPLKGPIGSGTLKFEKSKRSPSGSTHRKDLEHAAVRHMGAP